MWKHIRRKHWQPLSISIVCSQSCHNQSKEEAMTTIKEAGEDDPSSTTPSQRGSEGADIADEGGVGGGSSGSAAEPSPPEPSADQGISPAFAGAAAGAAASPAAASSEAQEAGQQSTSNEPTAPTDLPWYRRYQGPLIIALLLVVVALIAALVAVIVNNNQNNSKDGGANEALAPGPSSVDPPLTGVPTGAPTSGPTNALTSGPTNGPTSIPSPDPSIQTNNDNSGGLFSPSSSSVEPTNSPTKLLADPASKEPSSTVSPSSESFSAKPSLYPSFSGPCFPLEIGIIFDEYPGENSWMLVQGNYENSSGNLNDENNENDVVWESKFYSPIEFANRADTLTNCFPPGNYTFVFQDREGDGICCSHGEGSYVLTSEGKVIKIGVGSMDSEYESVAFELPYRGPQPMDENGDGLDDRLGWIMPYDSSNLTAGIDCENFHLEILTDQYGVETTWELYEGKDNGTTSGSKLIANGGPYGSESVYVIDYCLASPKEYALYVYDWDRRGLCCESGEGYYKVTSGDIVIRDSTGEFGEVNITRFVLPADGSVVFDDHNEPTGEPTVMGQFSPSISSAGPTGAPTPFPSSVTTSDSPSAIPTSTRFIQVVQKLTPLSGEDAFKERGSPQYLAAQWIADADPIPNLSTGSTGLDIDDPRLEQRYIMALFYFAMDGYNWKKKSKWLSSESECYWFGIDGASEGCGGVDTSTGMNLGGCVKSSENIWGDYDKVCRIGMGRLNNLFGQIPSELGYLSEMRWFEIQDDFLYGTIPDTLGTQWTKLHTFLVGGNYLDGVFPSTFENNEMLGTIFIDRNKFYGTFPNVFATLKNLEWLDAANNTFAGTMPDDVSKLRNLRILHLNFNSLSGNLPGSWDETNLIEDIEVAYNFFNGTLPPTLGKAKFLRDLRASGNQLTGIIPVEYYGLTNLEELYLDENMMSGELPQTAEPFYDGLQELSIHSNNFEGRFPVEYFEDTLRIKVLSLHSNQLTGTISENICARRDLSLNWSRLEKLTADCDLISCNCCTCYEDGELVSTFMPPTPSTVTLPSQTPTAASPNPIQVYASRPTRSPDFNLADRDTSLIQEQIETTVLQRSASFDDMDEDDPRYLALDWILNKDQRQLTADDVNLSQRYVLALIAFSLDSLAWYVCGDHRNGNEEYAVEDCEVFYEQTQQTVEYKVWLSKYDECTWYGVVCSSDWIVEKLELIGMDLIGQIPPEVSQLPVKILALSGNCLYGTIPAEIGSMSDLLSLELHGNGLSGSIPEEMYEMTQLQLLNVAMQYQYSYQCFRSDGTIVNTLFEQGDPAKGYNFGLVGAILNSRINQLADLKGLHIFDNSFDGEISGLIGGLEDLRFLRAQNNLLEGVIPNGMVELKNLRELYLEKNSIWGDLPPDIGMMDSLEDLRVNENELNGQLPDSLYNLFNIQKLWLQDTLKCELVDFDWECNADSEFGFEGSIHTEIGSLSKLTHLLINNNPIGGTLPTELGLCHDLAILHIHKTNIEGTVPDEVCLLRDKNLYDPSGKAGVFYADCGPNDTTGEPFIQCVCCSDCCDHTTKTCIADI